MIGVFTASGTLRGHGASPPGSNEYTDLPFEPTRNEAITLSTTSQNIASVRPDRRTIYIKNLDTAINITVVFGPRQAVAGVGIVLGPGEYIVDSVSESYAPYRGPIQAIAASGTPILALYER